MTSKHIKINEEPQLQPMNFKPDPPKPNYARGPPPPSPSKFIKGEFRESDYESDYDSRLSAVWRPNDSDSEPAYKPVRLNLTPTGRRSCISDGARSPTPPTEFDKPPQFDGPPRPKFQPIENPRYTVKLDHVIKTVEPQQHIFKPTPVSAKPTFNTRIIETTKPVKYYRGIAGTPLHNAVATETSNQMHMKESTENSHRVVNYSKTTRVIKFDEQKSDYEQLEPFPYSPNTTSSSPRQRVSLPPTPTKFVRGDFRESDYESEVESARIRPLWTPNASESDEPQYRRVQPPPPGRSSSLPRYSNYDRVVTPMEFDQYPAEMPSKIDVQSNNYKTQTLDRYSSNKKTSQHSVRTRDDIDVKLGSPPKYGYMEHASNQINDMSTTFKTKAHHLMNDIMTEVKTTSKPILKKTHSEESGKPQAYREESRVSQYGKYFFVYLLFFVLFEFSKIVCFQTV